MKAPELIAKVRNLPSISQAALALVGLLEQGDSCNEDIVQVLKRDSVLTAKLLRACNSPYLALDAPVDSVDQAVLILGHGQILHMVLTLAFGGAMSVTLPAYALDATDLLRHSFTAATAAEKAVNSGLQIDIDAPLAFTVGLLHDFGKLVIQQVLTPEMQSAIRKQVAEGLSTADAERNVVGVDHAEVGSTLLYMWRLPEPIIEGVANHHRPVLEPRPHVSAVASLANSIAHLAAGAAGCERYRLPADGALASAFEFGPDQIDSLVSAVREAHEKSHHLTGAV